MFGRGLKILSISTVVLIIGAFAMVFFYAPNDADQGFVQKIFYIHVPLAIVALVGFVVAAAAFGFAWPLALAKAAEVETARIARPTTMVFFMFRSLE